MEIIVKDAQPEVSESKSPEISKEIDSTPLKSLSELQMANMANFFNINLYDLEPKDREKINYIFESLKDGKNDFDEVALALRETKLKLGSPMLNERTLDKFYRYFRLIGQKNVISKEIEAEESK